MHSKPLPAGLIWGFDFSSAPSRRKPIWQASGNWCGEALLLGSLSPLDSMSDFEAALATPAPWIAGFDLPLGLPRSFIGSMGWQGGLQDVVRQMLAQFPDRRTWRHGIDAWRNAQAARLTLPHRLCDLLLPGGARSTSPLQTRYVPVALMLYEGLPRLLAAGATLPGQHPGDGRHVALEAYPGWLARRVLGRRSYKNGRDALRQAARAELLMALEQDAIALGFTVNCSDALRQIMLADSSGDPLDALICMVQAAWASRQPNWGQPTDVDPWEGWIVGAQPQSASTNLTMASDRLSPPP